MSIVSSGFPKYNAYNVGIFLDWQYRQRISFPNRLFSLVRDIDTFIGILNDRRDQFYAKGELRVYKDIDAILHEDNLTDLCFDVGRYSSRELFFDEIEEYVKSNSCNFSLCNSPPVNMMELLKTNSDDFLNCLFSEDDTQYLRNSQFSKKNGRLSPVILDKLDRRFLNEKFGSFH